jgi:hypothetical protein
MFLFDFLSIEADADGDLTEEELDTNGDGVVNADDCPYKHGTPKAKLWWKEKVEPFTETKITDDMRTKYGDRVIGAYKGKPLVPGEAGRGQGDFEFLVDKLRVTRGLTIGAAEKIAGKIKGTLYGG